MVGKEAKVSRFKSGTGGWQIGLGKDMAAIGFSP